MKKNQLFVIISLVLSLSIYGQPVITYSGNCPQVGDHFYQALFSGNIDPGPAGGNQTWDFSGVTSNNGNNAIFALDPSETPYGEYYPDANIAYNYNNDETYSYGLTSTAELLNLGTASLQNSMEIIIYYDNPAVLMEYPFTFNDSYNDTFSGSFSNGTLVVHQSGTISSLADGWGSISTPYGTYNSVLRVRSLSTQIDSAWMNGNFIYSSTTNYTHYEWYASDIHIPIFAINISENNGVTDTTGSYQTSPEYIQEPKSTTGNLVIFPNPATDKATVLYKPGNLNPITITVTDLNGGEMDRLKRSISSTDTQRFEISLTGLNSGIYFVNINDGVTSKSKKLFVGNR